MQSESAHMVGTVLQTFPDGRTVIEVYQDLSIGEIVRFVEALPQPGQLSHSPKVISRMESEEGKLLYQAKRGDIIVLRPGISVCPGDWLEKTQGGAGCLRVEAIIDPEDICFLNGVMEGYSDIAVLRTLDSSKGLVELLSSPDYREEMDKILLSLQEHMRFEIKAVECGALKIIF